MLRRFLLPTALLAFACLALPASADPAAPLPRPSHLRPDILYTHKGEFVQVKPMRALTLNAHISQFAYDPLGLEIAVVGSETSGDQTTDFVKTLDAHTGHVISRLVIAGSTVAQSTDIRLLGFSTSGKYLLLQRTLTDPQDSGAALIEYERLDLSADPPVDVTIRSQAALPPDAQTDENGMSGFASPDGHWIAFRQDYHLADAGGKPGPNQTACVLYDPERGTYRTLPLPEGVVVSYGWTDARHLNVRQNDARKQFDVVTGEVSPVIVQPTADASALSRQYPDLTLDTEYRAQEDKQPTGGHLGSYLIWIRRTPFHAQPLGATVAGLMPEYREEGADSDPQAVWSPTGKQIAFISGGDLSVTDLVTATGTFPREKLAVGLKLSCQEEQELAMTNLKQIGLGIIQYTQDNDENLPAADNWVKTLGPYLESTDVFRADGHAAVYEQPADLALAKMDAPAETEQAYINLPCARVVLFCDGHVKVFPKQ